MAANADALRAAVRQWGARVVQTAAAETINGVSGDRRVLAAPHKPASAPDRRRPDGRVTQVTAGASAARASVRINTYGWRWQSSGSARPFAPREHHANLGGRTFGDWRDPILGNRTQLWLGVSHFFPGDHRGCRCSSPSSPARPDMRVWPGAMRDHFQRSIRAAAARTPI